MGVGVHDTVVHQHIVATQHPSAAGKRACGDLNQVNFYTVHNLVKEELCVLTLHHHSELAALQGKGVIVSHRAGGHTAGSTVDGILLQIGGGGSTNVLTRSVNGVGAGGGIDSDLVVAGFFVQLIDLKEGSLSVDHNHQTALRLSHAANDNFPFVVKSNAMLGGEGALADHNAVVDIGFHVGTAAEIEIVTIGGKHYFFSGFLFIVLCDVHHCGQSCFGSVADAVDDPLVFGIGSGGIKFAVEQLLGTAFADGLLHVLDSITVVGIAGVIQHIGRKCGIGHGGQCNDRHYKRQYAKHSLFQFHRYSFLPDCRNGKLFCHM